MKEISFSVNIPVTREFDLIVAGGGLSGLAAAWNAAQNGLKVGICEYFGKLGGVVVSGMLGIVSGLRLEHELIIDGQFIREITRRTKMLGGINAENGWQIRFDPEKLSMALLQIMEENNIHVAFFSKLTAADVDNGVIKHVVISGKNGLEAWSGKIFVDDTGDGDLAFYAGAEFEYGRKSDGKVQSSSLTFRLAGIDMKKIPDNMVEATRIWRSSPHNVPTDHTVITYLPNTNGEAAVNMTHILNCNPLTDEGIFKIRREGIQQAYEIAEFFRGHIPGFKNCYVSQCAMQSGVRETRRIIGDYILTEDDVISGHDFPDEIVRGGWGIDIHAPDKVHGGDNNPHFLIDKSYGIPYRCITPKNFKNLYIAGRPISATHAAFSSSRINGTCIGIGEAIGVAASLFNESGSDIRKIDVTRLQEKLMAQNAIVHRKMAD